MHLVSVASLGEDRILSKALQQHQAMLCSCIDCSLSSAYSTGGGKFQSLPQSVSQRSAPLDPLMEQLPPEGEEDGEMRIY